MRQEILDPQVFLFVCNGSGFKFCLKNKHIQTLQNKHEISPACRPIIESAVVQVFAIRRVDLCCQSRGQAKVALARQVAMYLAHVVCGLTFTEVGSQFDRDRTTVAHACCVVEDRRDDEMFDTVVELLECAVLAMLCASDPRSQSHLGARKEDIQ